MVGFLKVCSVVLCLLGGLAAAGAVLLLVDAPTVAIAAFVGAVSTMVLGLIGLAAAELVLIAQAALLELRAIADQTKPPEEASPSTAEGRPLPQAWSPER